MTLRTQHLGRRRAVRRRRRPRSATPCETTPSSSTATASPCSAAPRVDASPTTPSPATSVGRVYPFDASAHRIDGQRRQRRDQRSRCSTATAASSSRPRPTTASSATRSPTPATPAIVIAAGSHRTVIEGNTTSRSSATRQSVDDSDGVVVVDNTFHLAGGAAISLGNADDGVITRQRRALQPRRHRAERVRRQPDREQRRPPDPGRRHLAGEALPATRSPATVANDTGGTGIAVEGEALDAAGNPIHGNVIEANDATGNLGDGISVSAPATSVTGNDAYNNGAWGITRRRARIDGGGNIASGNGEPEQCVGVVCAPGHRPARRRRRTSPRRTRQITGRPGQR